MATRRQFLRIGAGSAGAFTLAGSFQRLGLMNAMAQSTSGYKALVCIFLYGGNDSNNLIVPMSSQGYTNYSGIRKNLALAQSSLLPIGTSSNAAYGLHPNVPELQALYNSKNLAMVANVGTLVAPTNRQQFLSNQTSVPSNLFSHADQQNEWQTDFLTGNKIPTGWAGRVADIVQSQNGAVSGTHSFPTFISVAGNALMGVGANSRAATVIPNGALGLSGSTDTSPAGVARTAALQQLLKFDSGVTLIQAAKNNLSDGITDSATLQKALAGIAALKTVFPKTSIGAQLQQVAKLIQVRSELQMNRQIFFASLGGFDTHTAQLPDQINLYTQLSQAMSAFYAATQELAVAPNVTTFTESDFSRTCAPNTNSGSDHAWGSHHMVMGGAVKGGDLYGTFPQLILGGPDDAGSEGRWIPTTSLAQYGATLASWLGVSASDLSTSVFPNLSSFTTPTLPFLG